LTILEAINEDLDFRVELDKEKIFLNNFPSWSKPLLGTGSMSAVIARGSRCGMVEGGVGQGVSASTPVSSRCSATYVEAYPRDD
jgi:hypothetical protein